MNHRGRAEKFREDNGWPWCGECELDDSCSGCEIGLKDLEAAFAEVEAEALERAAVLCDVTAAEAENQAVGIDTGMIWSYASYTAMAKAIRALKEKIRTQDDELRAEEYNQIPIR
jgi:hypothetical protein